jgi:glucose-1-phosphate thymidylyltransferase
MAVTRTDDASDYGVVSLDGDQVTTITEKPHDPAPTELINAGVYGFAPSIFTAIRDTPTERGELALPTTLERIAADQPIQAVRYQGTWLDVSHLWDLLDVNAAMIDAAEDRDQPALDGAIASDTAIGDDVVLGPNATVEGGTALGANVTVEANAVLANAVVFPDAVIEAGAVVRDAIIASNVRIGANTTIAGGATTVVVEGEVHDDVTLGGVVGDNATVGSGVTVDPGSVIGDGATVAHGASVDGRIEPDAVVRRG